MLRSKPIMRFWIMQSKIKHKVKQLTITRTVHMAYATWEPTKMMAIKLVSPIWNKTFLISFVADKNWSVRKKRFNCLKMATFNTAMTIAGMMYNTADTMYRVHSSKPTIQSVAIIMIVNKIAQRWTFSVSLEIGRWLSLVRMAKSKCCTCFTYMFRHSMQYLSMDIATAVKVLRLNAALEKTSIL